MSIESQPVILAVLTGLGFGVIVHWLWCWSAGKTAAVLLALWLLQTFSQQLWRVFDGLSGWEEVWTVSTYRLAFAAAAVVVTGLLHRRCDE